MNALAYYIVGNISVPVPLVVPGRGSLTRSRIYFRKHQVHGVREQFLRVRTKTENLSGMIDVL